MCLFTQDGSGYTVFSLQPTSDQNVVGYICHSFWHKVIYNIIMLVRDKLQIIRPNDQ